jgi:nitrogen PTS system EIIA component
MTLADIIDARTVLPNLHAQSKRQLLQELSEAAAPMLSVDARLIFETLRRREKLGSTGLGQGIAIPHGKLAGLSRVYGLFARLAAPVAFDSIDGQPVDLVFLLMAPEHAGADHLKALARISRLLRDSATVSKLRGAEDAAALYAILTEPTVSASAA